MEEPSASRLSRERRGGEGWCHTLAMPVKENALGFEDKDDVLGVRSIHDSCRLVAEELVGLIHFLKHVKRTRAACENSLFYFSIAVWDQINE